MVFIKWVKRPPSSCTCPSALPFIVVLKPYVYGFAKKKDILRQFYEKPPDLSTHCGPLKELSWPLNSKHRFIPPTPSPLIFISSWKCFWTRFSALLTSLQQKFSLQITGFNDSNLPDMLKIYMAIDHPQWIFLQSFIAISDEACWNVDGYIKLFRTSPAKNFYAFTSIQAIPYFLVSAVVTCT